MWKQYLMLRLYDSLPIKAREKSRACAQITF